MRIVSIALLALAACYSEDNFGQYTIDVNVTSDVPLDRADVMYGSPNRPPETAPITPGRRARGEVDREVSSVIYGSFISRELARETEAHVSFEELRTPTILVVGYQRDAGGGLRVVAAVESSRAPFNLRLTAAGAIGLEVWGDERRCARVASGPHYYVSGQDLDCDGLVVQDCNDLDHCDLDAPTAAERAGCETVRCEPCLDRTPGACALGSRSSCRDQGVGAEPTVTCDGDAACGPVTCLPESTCRGAFSECFGEWPDIDPRPCLDFRWGEGRAGADGIQCALPAEPHLTEPTGGLICPGGSTVEAALPFTDCSDAQVAIGDTIYETAAAVIVPPCTVRLTLIQTERVYLRARGVLVTFSTGGTSTSARFQLTANPNTCGTTGTCLAPPEASLCTR